MNELIIDVKNLNKHFGSLHAVKNLSLQARRGEIFGFLGPNGSGKTTTIRMLCGLLTPDSGSGHCLGYDIIKDSLHIKKHVGYMTQKYSFYEDMTVYENFDFVAQIYQISDRKNKINKIIDEFYFEDKRNQLTGQLSGGWKQRVALAASLLHEPQLLLLDEPTAGVDPKARREFWDKINELSERGITTLVSTHYMDEAERCTRLAYICYGDLLIEGSMHEIIKKVGLVTWSVQGENLTEFAKKVRTISGVDQVTMFGESLHISGIDEEKLAAAIQPYQQKPQYRWQKIDTNLEDIFIHLVDKQKDLP